MSWMYIGLGICVASLVISSSSSWLPVRLTTHEAPRVDSRLL